MKLNEKMGLIFLAFVTFVSAADMSAWSSYRVITVAPAAAVTAPVNNFPVLVRLNSTNFSGGFTAPGINGASGTVGGSIRFTTDDSLATPLPFERERFDAANSAAEYWVLTSIPSGTAGRTFRVYYSNAAAADSSTGTGVFSRGNNFLGVWHMGNPVDPAAPTTSPRRNSANPGVNEAIPSVNQVPGFAAGYTVKTGQVGLADTLVGGSTGTGGSSVTPGAYFDMGPITDTAYKNFSTGLTISMWARISSAPNPSTSAYTRLVEINTGFNMNAIVIDRSNQTTSIRSELNTNGQASVATNGWKADDTYHHIVLTVSNSTVNTGRNVIFYIDGVPSTTLTIATALVNIQRTLGRFGCGTPAEDRESLTGALDEIEISNVDRSADWHKLNFDIQKAASIVSVGAAVATAVVPGAPTGVVGTAGNSQVSLTWAAPASNGGATITAYTATSSPEGKTCSTTGGLTCTVTGLTNSTGYTFTVTATNVAGTGAASAASSTVTPTAIAGVPDAPTGVTALAGNAQATVSWMAPASSGSSAITGYTATSNPDGKTCTTTGTLTCVVSALTNGAAYTFTVTATNTAGTSAPSVPSVAVTPKTVPGLPIGVTGAAGNALVVVSWSAPASNGGATITGYTVTSSPENKTCTTTGALTCTVSALTNGSAYTFTVTATNSVGTGAASTPSASVTPVTVPSAPTVVSVVGASGQVTVTWAAPVSNGGSPITGYTATASDTTKKCTTTGATTLTCVVTGLTNTTAYTFTVTAKNAVGTSVASAVSQVVTHVFGAASESGFGIEKVGSSLVFHLPGGLSRSQISVLDVWGRTVWNQTAAAGLHSLSWNGTMTNGRHATGGVYVVRLKFNAKAMEQKIAYSP